MGSAEAAEETMDKAESVELTADDLTVKGVIGLSVPIPTLSVLIANAQFVPSPSWMYFAVASTPSV